MTFNSDNYTTKQRENGNSKIAYRAYKNIP